jgi:hypothetical protein
MPDIFLLRFKNSGMTARPKRSEKGYGRHKPAWS